MNVSIVQFPGTNCEYDTQYAFEKLGAKTKIVWHKETELPGDTDLAVIAGGFSYGDYLRSGAIARFSPVMGAVESFAKKGGRVLGICNGFQVLVRLGILPGWEGDKAASLIENFSGKFEDRWVSLKINVASPCVFTKGMTRVYLPIRHGEGKFYPASPAVLDEIKRSHLDVMAYIDPVSEDTTATYPFNPNGSVDAIAALCDPTGRVFGMMPHPEAFLHRTNHPRWTREVLPEEGQGVLFFRNAVDYLRNRTV